MLISVDLTFANQHRHNAISSLRYGSDGQHPDPRGNVLKSSVGLDCQELNLNTRLKFGDRPIPSFSRIANFSAEFGIP